MSAIVGIFDRKGAPVERALVRSLTHFLAYCGPDSRDVWLCLFALAWVGLAISTALAKSQMAAKWPAVIQIGVPVLGLVGWLAAKELARSFEAQPRQPDVQPVMRP